MRAGVGDASRVRAGDMIRQAVEQGLVDEDGEAVDLDPSPGLSAAEIDAFVRSIGGPVPEAMRLVLAETTAFGGAVEVDFMGAGGVDLLGLLSRWLEIAGDGAGNFWVLDLDAGSVWFHAHDPPALVFQAPDLDVFVAQVIEANESDEGTAIETGAEIAPTQIWDARSTQGTLTTREDDRFAFGEVVPDLPERYRVIDLTAPSVGDGVAWADGGAELCIRRHPDHAAFVVTTEGGDERPSSRRRSLRFLRGRSN